jgi:hypothetical protein
LPESLLAEVLGILKHIELTKNEYAENADVTLPYFDHYWYYAYHDRRWLRGEDEWLTLCDPFCQVKLFRALVPYLSGDLLQEALIVARGIEELNTHAKNQLITRIASAWTQEERDPYRDRYMRYMHELSEG